MSDETPFLLIIAGPNGSGKTSAYRDAEIETSGKSVWIINPDQLALRISTIERLSQSRANLEAVRRIAAWLDSSVSAHQTVGVETVLSTDKYRPLVLRAKKLSFEIRLVYVILNSPLLNIERVRIRVEKGGHGVPRNKIVERYWRSLEQLPWFLDQADRAWVLRQFRCAPASYCREDRGHDQPG